MVRRWTAKSVGWREWFASGAVLLFAGGFLGALLTVGDPFLVRVAVSVLIVLSLYLLVAVLSRLFRKASDDHT